jgi:hypothetical protein
MKKLILIGFLFCGSLQAQDTIQPKLRAYGARQFTAQSIRLLAIPLFYFAAKQAEKENRNALLGVGIFLEAAAFAIEFHANIVLRDK